MPKVTPSQAKNIPPDSLRLSLACPQPGIRKERQRGLRGLMYWGARVSGGAAGPATRGAAGGGGTAWALRSTAHAKVVASTTRRISHDALAARRWRERVGIEPTGAAGGASIAVLKTGQTTRPDPLPSSRR